METMVVPHLVIKNLIEKMFDKRHRVEVPWYVLIKLTVPIT